MIRSEMISMNLIDIRPAEIQTGNGPKDELDTDKNAQEPMYSPSVELIVFSHLLCIHDFEADFGFIPSHTD